MMEHGGLFLGLDVLQATAVPLRSRLIDSKAFLSLNIIAYDGWD
jgi:hypothetical protein